MANILSLYVNERDMMCVSDSSPLLAVNLEIRLRLAGGTAQTTDIMPKMQHVFHFESITFDIQAGNAG